jgi:hypothetical protein
LIGEEDEALLPCAIACCVVRARSFGMQGPNLQDARQSDGDRPHVCENGRPCSIIIAHTAGPIFTASLVGNASNGTVAVTGQRVVYTSRAGFVGDDRFTYARRGLNTRNEPIVRTVNVRVNVAAK